MAETALHHKLAAILAADAVGYSRLMHQDEAATVDQLDACRDIFRRHVEAHHGRIVDTAGDSVLATFETATGAVKAALAAQAEIAARNGSLPEGRRMLFRAGVNLGETFEKADGTIYGDGVNIAARLQALAEPGGACVSEAVATQTRAKVDATFVAIGAHTVKNIAEPVRAFRLEHAGGAGMAKRRVPWRILAPAVALILALAAVGAWLWRDLAAPAPAPAGDRAQALALPDKPSIAVLPFANLSGDPEQEYFSDGLTEDIITALSRNRDLFVIARNSTFQYKGQAVKPETVARKLGVRYLVEGSVRKSDNRVRVTAQLIEAAGGGHVWAETYDRELADIFAVQDQLTQQITVRAGVAVAAADRERAQQRAPADLSAYDLVLRAVRVNTQPTRENLAHDRDLFEKALSLDPGYARAHASLAITILTEYEVGLSSLADSVALAGEHARRAVELDPADSRAHYALAHYHFYNGRMELFEKELDKAIALNPNDASVLALGGSRLQHAFGLDRLAEGAEMARLAMRLNPHYGPWYAWPILREYYFTGRYSQALEELNRMGYTDDYIWDQVMRAIILAQLGNDQAAQKARDQLLKIKPDYTLQWHLILFHIHESYWPDYIEGARKAGLPLGDLSAFGVAAQ